MSAMPASAHGADRRPAGSRAAAEWAQIGQAAPQLAATMRRYLTQVAAFLAPRSVDVADSTLRQLARWLLASTGIETAAEIRRDDIEDFKTWLAGQAGNKGTLSANTHRQRLRTLRAFFERIIEWDWPEAPPRNPVLGGDIPKKPEPLPKFLDDRDAAKVMAAARACPGSRDRLVIELLARTGVFSLGHNWTDRTFPGFWLVSGLQARRGRATGVAHVRSGRVSVAVPGG